MNTAVMPRSAIVRRGDRILPGYSSMEYRRWWPAVKLACIGIAVFLALYTGFLVAIAGTRAIGYVAVPLVVMGGLALWMLPDVDHIGKPPYYKLVSAYLFLLVAWPGYVAIEIPGLPWVTPPRLVLGVMLVTMLVHFPQVREARQRVTDVIGQDGLSWKLFLTYMVMEMVALPFSDEATLSLTYAANHALTDLAPMLVAAWLMHDVRQVPRVMRVLVYGAIFAMLVTVLENWMQQPPWMNYIPSFMRIDQSLAEVYFSPQSRIGDNRYRIRSTFPIVIYYAQYLAVLMPIILYEMWQMRGAKRVLAFLLVPLIWHSVWFVNARTAMIGLILTLLGFAMLAIARTLRDGKGDGLKRGILIMLMGLGIVGIGGVLATSHRAQMYTFGGSQHAASNDTREVQWQVARSEVRKHPVGKGMGVPNYNFPISPSGLPIVDSYFINLLIGVGPIGFIGFIGCFLRLSWLGIAAFLRSTAAEQEWAAALALSILNFVISAYVVSFDDNIYLPMVMGAGILAIRRAQKLERDSTAKVPAIAASPGQALVVRRAR